VQVYNESYVDALALISSTTALLDGRLSRVAAVQPLRARLITSRQHVADVMSTKLTVTYESLDP
jgi:hypothetical protein